MGRIVNQRELGEIFEISPKSLSLWAREGLPVALETENGLANQYDTAAVLRWYVAREVAKGAKEGEKDRLSRLQGDKIEMEIAEKKRELIPSAEIEPAWIGMVVAARQALLTMPARIAPLLAQMEGAEPMRDLLEESIEEALQKLATHDDEHRAGGADDEGEGPLGAATAHLSVAMG